MQSLSAGAQSRPEGRKYLVPRENVGKIGPADRLQLLELVLLAIAPVVRCRSVELTSSSRLRTLMTV